MIFWFSGNGRGIGSVVPAILLCRRKCACPVVYLTSRLRLNLFSLSIFFDLVLSAHVKKANVCLHVFSDCHLLSHSSYNLSSIFDLTKALHCGMTTWLPKVVPVFAALSANSLPWILMCALTQLMINL